MKLIRISGHLWELTIIQNSYTIEKPEDWVDEINNAILSNKYGYKSMNFLANNYARSEARAIIEIDVNGLTQQESYTIYHNSKGFYCNVQKERIFLKDILR